MTLKRIKYLRSIIISRYKIHLSLSIWCPKDRLFLMLNIKSGWWTNRQMKKSEALRKNEKDSYSPALTPGTFNKQNNIMDGRLQTVPLYSSVSHRRMLHIWHPIKRVIFSAFNSSPRKETFFSRVCSRGFRLKSRIQVVSISLTQITWFI